MGRMSSKRMPGEGKSGNWRRARRRLIVRLVSSVEPAVAAAESLPLGALEVRVGSGFEVGGCEAVAVGSAAAEAVGDVSVE